MSCKSSVVAAKLLWVAMTTLVTASSLWPQSDGSTQVIMGLQKPPQLQFASSLPPGLMAEKTTTACTECHEARIIVQQRLSKAAWTKEVDKMVKWGALVDPNDRDALIDYLSTNFSVDKPPYIPSRTSAVKTSGGQTSRQAH